MIALAQAVERAQHAADAEREAAHGHPRTCVVVGGGHWATRRARSGEAIRPRRWALSRAS